MKFINRGIVLATIICVTLGAAGCGKSSSDLGQGKTESVATVSTSDTSANVSFEVTEKVIETSISEEETEPEDDPEIKSAPFEERLLVAPGRDDVESEISAVLYDNAPFTVFENRATETNDPNERLAFVSKEFALEEYDYLTFYSDNLDGEYEPMDIYFKGFSIIDIDGDGLDELVYYVNADIGDPGHYLVFSVVDKEVCAYIINYRNMGTLKTDGTMDASDAADNGDIWTIARFSKEGYEKKVLATLRGEEYRIGEHKVSWDEWQDYVTNEISTKGVLWTATEDVDSWLNYYSR